MVQRKLVTRPRAERETHLDRLYDLLYHWKERIGGFHTLADATGSMNWPEQGVYFFFSSDETRTGTKQRRITRVGTHAVTQGSTATLWNRLRQHRGPCTGKYSGGGNHRGSVFRLHVGNALIQKHGLEDTYKKWGVGTHADQEIREQEHSLEKSVSNFIRGLPFLCLPVPGEAGPDNLRAIVERNSIALLSNYGKEPVDPRAADWLGKDSPAEEITASGLWNIEHVQETYTPRFLDDIADQLETVEEK